MVPILKVPEGRALGRGGRGVRHSSRLADGPLRAGLSAPSPSLPGMEPAAPTAAPDALAGRSPAERHSTPVDGVEVLGALSPSRAQDFLDCALAYRFRTIDRLPEPPSSAAVRGTVVHRVLEQLFDLPAARRTPTDALALLTPAWAEVREAEPAVSDLFADDAELEEWLASCVEVLEAWFALEDPTRLEPAAREVYVEALLESRLLLRGFVDRVDVAPDGAVRIVDYKGLARTTPLPTPEGWTTMGEVAVGDRILGSDGRATTVTAKSAVHHRPCYRVSLSDGSSVVCDNVHLWQVTTSQDQQQTTCVVDTESLRTMHLRMATEGRPRSMWIQAPGAVQGQHSDDLPVPPWLLGAWLGDGASRSGQITVGRDDVEEMVGLVRRHWSRGVHVRPDGRTFAVTATMVEDRCSFGHDQFRPATPGHPSRRCARESAHRGRLRSNVALTTELRRAGLLHRKHIPASYLRASIEQRTDLVRGLMDTDGWWNTTRRRAGFTTTDDRLAEDVLELLRSLGQRPTHFTKAYVNPVRPPRTCHIIEFTPVGLVPFSLPRKAIPCAEGITDQQRSLAQRLVVTAVEPVESVETQCIAVDAPDSLYLCGRGFVPTHNTGRAPAEGFEQRALFQMKFYALVWWRLHGVVPRVLRLTYLGSGEVVSYEPDEQDLEATRRKVEAIWAAIEQARADGDFQPNRSRRCDWCAHQALCPAWGGTPPPMPTPEVAVPDVTSARGGQRRTGTGRSAARTPARVSAKTRAGPGGTSTCSGTTSTEQPAASAEAAPGGESSIATHAPGSTPSRAAAVR